jgi:DNA-binding response OmpR family regulator
MTTIHNPIILVVDADSLMATAVAAVLHSQNYEVICAGNAQAAQSAAQENPLDLLICDTIVDHVEGADIVQAIQSIPGRNDVPIMFMSENQATDVVLKKYDSGNAYYIRKPFDARLLIELVANALWMPHLVQSHIHQPHISLATSNQKSRAPIHRSNNVKSK